MRKKVIFHLVGGLGRQLAGGIVFGHGQHGHHSGSGTQPCCQRD